MTEADGKAVRLEVFAGDGVVGRWTDAAMVAIGPRRLLDQLFALSATTEPHDLLETARLLDWSAEGGGYGFVFQHQETTEIDGAGACDLLVDERRLPIEPADIPDDQSWTSLGIVDRRASVRRDDRGLELGLDLRAGIVPGRGLLLVRKPTQLVDQGEEDPTSLDVLSSGRPFESFDLSGVDEPERGPLPIAESSAGAEAAAAKDAVMVEGSLCSAEHVNHPNAQYCFYCGRAMVDHTRHRLGVGPRHSPGVLVFDEGNTYHLNREYVIGRQSPADVDRRMGSIRLDDDAISRKHATIELNDWDVVLTDLGSTNGTFVQRPKAADWERLSPDAPHMLEPGSNIRFGTVRHCEFHALYRLA